MNPYAIPPLITDIILLVIGLFVYLKNRASKLNIIFSLFSFSMVVWLFGYTNMYLSKEPSIALKWARIGFLGIIFIPIFAYHFIISFLNLKRKIILPIIYLLAVPSLLLSQTNYIYSGIKEHFWGYYPIAGRIYFVFLSMFGVLFTKGVLLLFSYLRKESGLKRNQIKYVCLSFGLGAFGIVDYLVKYPIFDVYPFGYVCALLFTSLIAFAIVRYRLLDITIALTRAGIFAIVYTLVLGIPFWLGYATKAWFPATSLAVILATIGPFIYNHLRQQAENLLRKEQLEYQKELRDISSTMMLIKELEKLLRTIVLRVVDIVKVSWAGIYLKDEKETKYILKYQRARIGEINLPGEFSFDSELVKHFYQAKLPLIGEEIHSSELKVGTSTSLSADVERLSTALGTSPEFIEGRSRTIGLAVPCFIEDNLLGFILLGDKPKGQVYDESDVNTFTFLSNQTALAIENCQFYSQERQREHLRRIASLDRQIDCMAHEMDNPIHALLGVLGSIELALDELKEVIPFEKMEYLKQKLSRVEFNAKRVSKMISAVKEFTRPTTGEFSPITLEHIIDSFVAIINPQLHYYGINFILNLPKEPIWLKANKVELEQVLVNLGTNSVQAIKEAPKENKKEITLTAYKKNPSTLRIDFTDTGSGIEKKLLEDIFLDFVTTKASSEGTGLGLSISRKIISRHKGRLWAESEGAGKGATFHIELPIANDVTEEEKRKFQAAQNEDKKRELI